MARIQNLELDRNLSGLDKFVGTDSSNNATVNFTIDQLSEYLLQTGYADPSRIGFVYNYTRRFTAGNAIGSGELQVEFAQTAPSNPSWRHVGAIHFNATSQNGADFTPAAQIIPNQIIKLTGVQSIEDQSYGYYNVESVARVGSVYSVRVSSMDDYATGDLSLGDITITPAGQSNPNRIIGTGEILHGTGDPRNLADDVQMGLGEEGDFFLQENLIDPDNPIVVLYGPKPADDLWTNAQFVSLRGPQGEQGPTGATGAAAMLSNDPIVVNDIAPGTTGSGTITGGAQDMTFTLNIPRGADGADGGRGEQGFQGDGTEVTNVASGAGPGTVSTVTFTNTDVDPATGAETTNTQTVTIQPGQPGADSTVPGPAGVDGDSITATVDTTTTPGEVLLTVTSIDGGTGTPTIIVDNLNIRGTMGNAGADGATPDITVGTVTTGAPGTNVMVVRRGTDADPIFDFTIPQGATGAAGTGGYPVTFIDVDGNAQTFDSEATSAAAPVTSRAYVDQQVTAEANTRSTNDTALGTRIDGEATARENADTALGGRIDTEVTDRTAADTTLQNNIDAEATARMAADADKLDKPAGDPAGPSVVNVAASGDVAYLGIRTDVRDAGDAGTPIVTEAGIRTAIDDGLDTRLAIPAGLPTTGTDILTVNARGEALTDTFTGIYNTITTSTTAITPDGMNAIADGGTDTLTFVAGEGISIQTDSMTDSIIITNTGGGGTDTFRAVRTGAITMEATAAVTYNIGLQAQTGFTYSFTAATADGGDFVGGIVSAGQTFRVTHPAIAAGGDDASHTYTLTYVATPDGGAAEPAATIAVTLTATAPPEPPTQEDFIYYGTYDVGATDPITTSPPLARLHGAGNPAAAGTGTTRVQEEGNAISAPFAGGTNRILFIAVPTADSPTFFQTAPSMFSIVFDADQEENATINGVAYTIYKSFITLNTTIRITI